MFIKSVFKSSFRFSYVLYITAVTLNHADEVFSFTGQDGFYGVRLSGRKEGLCGNFVRNVGTT